jgi:hypothetical protein
LEARCIISPLEEIIWSSVETATLCTKTWTELTVRDIFSSRTGTEPGTDAVACSIEHGPPVAPNFCWGFPFSVNEGAALQRGRDAASAGMCW